MLLTGPAETQRKWLWWIGKILGTTRASIVFGLTLQLECSYTPVRLERLSGKTRSLEGFKQEFDTGRFAEWKID